MTELLHIRFCFFPDAAAFFHQLADHNRIYGLLNAFIHFLPDISGYTKVLPQAVGVILVSAGNRLNTAL